METQPLGIDREIDPKHLELLKQPLVENDVPDNLIHDCITTASLLGALLRSGVDITDEGYHKIGLTNIVSQAHGGDNSSTVELEGSLKDETTEFTADLIARGFPVPSPLAIGLPTNQSSTLYTSNSEDPRNGVLGIVLNYDNIHFRIEQVNGKMFWVKIMKIDGIEDQISLIRGISVNYKDGKPTSARISQGIEVKDSLYEKSRHLMHNLARLKRLMEMGAPDVVINNDKGMARSRIAAVAELAGKEFEGEELTELIVSLQSKEKEEILKTIFKGSDQEERLQEILNMLGEDLVHGKRHELSATITPGREFGVNVDNLGRTTNLLADWKEIAREYSAEQLDSLIHFLAELSGSLNEDFDNLAAVVSGHIQIDEAM